MSLAKYMQLYREYGFFNGSTIRVRIPDTSFYGFDLILSKDGNVLRTRTIDDDVVDFFTDESGTLVLSADNGTSALSGEVKISAYGTYNITLEGTSVDKSREVYAEKDVTLDDGKTTDSVAIGYTGDISPISAISSNTSVCTVSVNGNKVIVKDAGKDFNGKATITATVEASQNYDAGEVNFYVNKLNGSLGTWEDASDEVIASMIAQADAGEINLADYWKIGETRTIHLDAIAAGTAIAAQPEQDIELVLMENTTGNSYYPLTTPLESGKAYPNFLIGTVDCLKSLSAMAYFSHTITATSSYGSTTNTSYVEMNGNTNAELIDMLNDDFVDALPEYIQNILKAVNRRYVCNGGTQSSNIGNNDVISYTIMGTKSHKVSLLNLRELGYSSTLTGGSNIGSKPSGLGIYRSNGSGYRLTGQQIADYINPQINSCGAVLQYFNQGNKVKKQGASGNAIDYFINDTPLWVSRSYLSGSSYDTNISMAFYIDSNGALQTNNLDTEAERIKLRGVAPIMFI